MPKVIMTYLDFDLEKSSVAFPMAALTNAEDLVTAVNAVSAGTLNKTTEVSSEVAGSNVAPESASAQRETGLRVYVSDNVNGRTGFFTIPCPNFAVLTYNQGQVVLADEGVMAALVTILQSDVVSRDGNAITVTSAEIVGRNT